MRTVIERIETGFVLSGLFERMSFADATWRVIRLCQLDKRLAGKSDKKNPRLIDREIVKKSATVDKSFVKEQGGRQLYSEWSGTSPTT